MLSLAEIKPLYTAAYIAEVISVFMGETVYLNRLMGIQNCAVNGEATVNAVLKTFNHIMEGKEMEAIGDAIEAAAIVRQELEYCRKDAPEDIAMLIQWMEDKMGSRQALVDAASANTHLHA